MHLSDCDKTRPSFHISFSVFSKLGRFNVLPVFSSMALNTWTHTADQKQTCMYLLQETEDYCFWRRISDAEEKHLPFSGGGWDAAMGEAEVMGVFCLCIHTYNTCDF